MGLRHDTSSRKSHKRSRTEPQSLESLGLGATLDWHPSTLYAPESAIRSTIHLGERPRSHGNAFQHQQPASAPPLLPLSYPTAAPSLVRGNETDTAPAHHWTPINKRKQTGQATAFTPSVPFTPCSPPRTRHDPSKAPVPLKAPIGQHIFENYRWPLPTNFHVDFNEIDSFQEPTPCNSPAPELQRTEALHVDQEDGRVWHLGHEPVHSYSGVFVHDDPNEIPLQAKMMVNAIIEKREKPERLRRSAEVLQTTRMHLEAGAVSYLQRTSFVEFGDSVLCFRSGCPCEGAQGIPPNQYYLSLSSECVDCESTFCLRCFEKLWNLDFTEGVDDPPGLAQPTEERRDSAFTMPLQVDGADDRPLPRNNDIFKSRHADPEEVPTGQPENYCPTPGYSVWSPSPHDYTSTGKKYSDPDPDDPWAVRTPGFIDPPTPRTTSPAPFNEPEDDHNFSSPKSTTSTGEWRHPPTRFQHIAFTVKPGFTISTQDKAVLNLWKFQSRAQLQWELHLCKTRCVRDYYNGLAAEDKSLGMKGYRWDDEEEPKENADLKTLEEKAKLKGKECYGRDLSEVLREAAAKK